MQGQAPWGPWAQGRDLPSPDLGRAGAERCFLGVCCRLGCGAPARSSRLCLPSPAALRSRARQDPRVGKDLHSDPESESLCLCQEPRKQAAGQLLTHLP